MRKIYLSIGSNKGNRYSFIKEALRLIRKDIGKVILMSKIYETKSWGFQSDDFLNICIMIKSELLPSELLNKLKNIEDKIGRNRDSTKILAREIDIDILFYSDKIINHEVIMNKRIHGYAKGGGSFAGKIKLIKRTLLYIIELRKKLWNL